MGLERGWDEGLPEFGDWAELFGGFGDGFFEPGDQDVAEACGGAGFG